MKALWLVSFRPIGKSMINDFYQSTFVDSIKAIDFDITFSLTQFNEPNVEKFIDQKKIKKIYINTSKNDLPENKKYSNKLMLDNALDQYLKNEDFQYLIYSTADIIVPNNLFSILQKINDENFCAFVYPNTHVKNGLLKNSYWPYYGIDLIVFKLSKTNAKNFKYIIKDYNQYDWGINENFYIAASEALNLKRVNLFKFCNVLKFENDFETFVEDRSWQVKSWRENQKYFITFLKKNNLNRFYAYGSYYFLLYKIFHFKDLNIKLFFAYLIFYPYNLSKKLIRIIKKYLIK